MHIRVMTWFAIASVVAAIACGTTAVADGGMASEHYTLPWSALSAGSQGMSSSAFTMQGSIAWTAAHTAVSDRFSLSTGYWPGWLAMLEAKAQIYLPIVLRDR